ncbi:hypothetical protein SERLADRAFT_441366 [Serpula lacrymans var. lacrymans S7.9]|uniref:MutS protein homolog 3 n=1 Tax=Serpula lacrymans var. lacrymans (strain S7.9) TaxID=578457 RepID=F8P6B4_SERL9|nr:uncharacterized protein SERLADRAFT_441366 [Serpula lacrymans var. lacrymans S7.9]EGO20981.1 hypothetical protein SERLADRAFT_441366 [Serpula lacrymans var. lacrymans S7.9]
MRRLSGSSPKTQPTISHYFSQHTPLAKRRTTGADNSPIDLTVEDGQDDWERPPGKRLKYSHDVSDPSTSGNNSSSAEQWRFDPSQLSAPHLKGSPESRKAEEISKIKRREEFKRVLLGENNVFIAGRGRNDDRETIEVGEDGEKGEDEQPQELSGDESDRAFKKLNEMFSHKSSKGKSKRKMATGTKEKAMEEEIGPGGQPYTPSEKQVLQFIRDNPGTMLMVETGYKYYFYEDSAKIASKELGIVCYMRRNLWTASVPVHRRDSYRLLSQGHKVGIIEQVETAALKKVSENRNTLFQRKLTHLYTATTYVDEMDSVDDLDKHTSPSLLCLVEHSKDDTRSNDVSIGMISISPRTGDVLPPKDTYMRIDLETRLVHTRPAELLLPHEGLSKFTEKLLTHYTESSTENSKPRLERFNDTLTYTEAFDFVSGFYADKSKGRSGNVDPEKLLASVTDFPQQVVIVLAHAIKYLSAFSIADAFLGIRFFMRFTNRTHMLLNGNTLVNLEIYRNETDFTTKGSLMWILDRTTTKFGARLLKSWVGRPLVHKEILEERMDAVEEIISSSSERLVALKQVLKKLPDLSKGLCRIQYGKCTPQELATLLLAFKKVATVFEGCKDSADGGFRAKLLKELVISLPKLKQPVMDLLGSISLQKAFDGRKDTLWSDPDKYPALDDMAMAIQAVEADLKEELKSIRKVLKKPLLQWTTFAGEEYLVELKKTENREVPPNWFIASRTKYLTRYLTPDVKKKRDERARYMESLQAEAIKAFESFLNDIVQDHYTVIRDAVNKLAIADCLLSFAQVALQDGYVRPQFTDEDKLEIIEGRHPMVEALRSDPFVPNSIDMGGDEPSSKIITGPNMGGKSSAVRMVALISIMAQIGSYVPAKSARLGLLDSILTRMGASDELDRGRSTFMVEMAGTSDILQAATSRSLVILDELGRGTSTVDGMAVAHAVLEHLVRNVHCKTLFITHYPLVAVDLERKFPNAIQNLHMGYTAETRINGTRDITFLYRLIPGIAAESFGVECARLAGVSEEILQVATERSQSYQCTIEKRHAQNRCESSN